MAKLIRLHRPFDNRSALLQTRPVSRGLFITFEGSEGCGKSTQVKRLAARLEQEGRDFLLTREPGGTAIGEKIRDLLQFAPEGVAMRPETEVLLFEASRSQLVREVIEPALSRGTLVISDRFFDSTSVYQGAARRLDPATVEQLNAFAIGTCVPDVTFVLDCDLKIARTRLLRRVRPVGAPDRMEQEPDDFYERVSDAYRQLAQREPRRVRLIDATRSADEIESEIWQLLQARLEKRASEV
jgi:dTMP kinase